MPIATYITTSEAAALLRYRSSDATIAYLRRAGLNHLARGRIYLWDKTEVLRLLETPRGNSRIG